MALPICHSCFKIILTPPLRHVWPEVVMENHTHTPVAHGKSHKYILHTYLKYGKILFRGKIVWATYLHDLLVRCFCCFLLLTGFVCLVHISDVIFDANQSREYKCSLFSSEISRSCLHWRHHLLFPFLASPNLCGSRCSSIDSFQIIISCCKFKYYSFPHKFLCIYSP